MDYWIMKAMHNRVIFPLLILLGCVPVYAANLSGVVSDEGDSVGMAEVMLVDAGNNVTIKTVYTNDKGTYRFSVKPGIYKIATFKDDYATAWVRDVSISDADVVVDIELTPEAFVEEKNTTKSDDCE